MSREELFKESDVHGWKLLPDEIYKRYRFTLAKVEVEEHHVGVYADKEEDHMVKAPDPGYLLRGSLVSPSLEAAIMNGKYVNAVPLYRLEKEFERYGIRISRQNMVHWTIQCADQYFAILYDYMHERLYNYHVIQADETPVPSIRMCARLEPKVICGSIARERCTETDRLFCTNISRPVTPVIRANS